MLNRSLFRNIRYFRARGLGGEAYEHENLTEEELLRLRFGGAVLPDSPVRFPGDADAPFMRNSEGRLVRRQ